MNRTRCPWCGKRIDKSKDKLLFEDLYSPTVPRFLRIANCHHCGHKYGQVPLLPYAWKIWVAVLLLVVLAFVFQSALLLVACIVPAVLLSTRLPYSKLDEKGRLPEINTDLLCEIEIIDSVQKIKHGELYFLNNWSFDAFEPFAVASPVHIYEVSKKSDVAWGEFLYMHEKNYDYIEKDCCDLYDTDMNLIARIKFRATQE